MEDSIERLRAEAAKWFNDRTLIELERLIKAWQAADTLVNFSIPLDHQWLTLREKYNAAIRPRPTEDQQSPGLPDPGPAEGSLPGDNNPLSP